MTLRRDFNSLEGHKDAFKVLPYVILVVKTVACNDVTPLLPIHAGFLKPAGNQMNLLAHVLNWSGNDRLVYVLTVQ